MEEKLIRRSQQEEGIELDDKVGPNKKKKTLVIPDSTILTQAFIMTFLAEWGDRSQIATIALAASYNLFMVNVGALLGHFLCTGGAVQLGEWISKKVSEKQVHYAGGIVFVLSGVVTMWMMFSHDG
jgi:putative Ca2+/H+ antiporter (TMEM165/GDT1 family)